MKQLFGAVWFLVGTAAFGQEITVRFEVTMPRHFQGEPRFFLAGNHPALGDWAPDRATLMRVDSLFTKAIIVRAGAPLQFKVTRGKWESREVTREGEEIPNRTAQCFQDCTLRLNVENSRLPTFHAVPVGASPSIFYHHEIYSTALDNYRNLAIYLPPQYFTEPHRAFPVLYALDGNNLFDAATMEFPGGTEWRLDETLDDAFSKGRLKPFIVVGIYNTKRRADEYVPCSTDVGGGMAAEYAEFIAGVVKPLIDGKYRTLPDRPNTALMGSSFGGTFTLYAAKTYPEVFSRFVALSPSFWPGDRCLFAWLKKPVMPLPQRLWMDMGDQADGVLADLYEGHRLLKESGVPDSHLSVTVEKGGHHHESDWGRRVERALKYVFAD